MTARATELQCQDAIVEAAILHGWYVHAERASLQKSGRWSTAVQGHVGWPDLVIVRDGVMIVRELKRAPNVASREQLEWLSRLRAAGVDARILWVPDQMDEFIRTVLPRPLR